MRGRFFEGFENLVTSEKVWEIPRPSCRLYWPRLLIGSHPFMELWSPKFVYSARSPNFFRYLVYLVQFEAGSAWQPKNPEKEILRLFVAWNVRAAKLDQRTFSSPFCWHFLLPRISLLARVIYCRPRLLSVIRSLLSSHVIATIALSREGCKTLLPPILVLSRVSSLFILCSLLLGTMLLTRAHYSDCWGHRGVRGQCYHPTR